jgi:hypothetical protein
MQDGRVVFYTVCGPQADADNRRSLAVIETMKRLPDLPPNWSFEIFISPEDAAGKVNGGSVAFVDGYCNKGRQYSPIRPEGGLASWAEPAAAVVTIAHKCNLDRCARQVAGVVRKRGVDSWGPKADPEVRKARRWRVRAKQASKAGPIYVYTRPYFPDSKFA